MAKTLFVGLTYLTINVSKTVLYIPDDEKGMILTNILTNYDPFCLRYDRATIQDSMKQYL